MWPCRSTLAGMTVLPVRSTRGAPGGIAIWPRRPTREKRFPSTMNAEFSIGAVPSPVINRAPSNIVTDEVPAWPKKSTEKHRDTKTQRHKGALQDFLMRAFVPLCLCVSVFFIRFDRVSLRMIHQAIGVHEHDCYTPGTVQEKWGSDALFAA